MARMNSDKNNIDEKLSSKWITDTKIQNIINI